MAKRPTRDQTRLFRELIAKLEPEIRKGFEAAARDLKNGINWKALNEALARNDVDGAIAELNIDRAAFNAYARSKQSAYVEGGTLAASTVNGPPGSTVAFRFDMSNPVAERWIAENVGNSITKLADEQRENVRAAILRGYEAGQHPETIALDLAGRMVNGQRQGGIIGLSAPQSEYVTSMRARLASGDPVEMSKVFGMERRDRRYDTIVREAIAEGKPPAKADIDQIVQRYSDRLLSLRAETIARTETGMAVMAGRAEEWRQACERLGYPVEAVTKTWRHGGGVKDPRPWHVAMNGKAVQGLNTPFEMATGARLQHSHDPKGGAREIISCSCSTEYRLLHTYVLALEEIAAEKEQAKKSRPAQPVQTPVMDPIALTSADIPQQPAGIQGIVAQVMVSETIKAVSSIAVETAPVRQIADSELAEVFGSEGLAWQWNEHVKVEPQAFIRSMTGGDDNPVFIFLSASEWNPGVFDLNYKLKNGALVNRTLNFASKTAEHVLFELPSEAQATGVAKNILKWQVDFYREKGIERITMIANIDVGGYAWARYGFVPRNPRAFFADLKDELDTIASLPDDIRAYVLELLNSDNPKTIWEIANLQYDVGGEPLGKRLLLGSSWEAVMDLTDIETMQKFEAYIARGTR